MGDWRNGVVVGVDGSEESLGAAEWAAAVAERHGTQLVVLGTSAAPSARLRPGYAFADSGSLNMAPHSIELALDRIRRERGGLDVITQIIPGSAARLLTLRSWFADLVVIGSREPMELNPRSRTTVVASVVAALAAMAHGPVAVVPRTAAAEAPRRVIALLDDDPELVLRLAFEEAAVSAAPLELFGVLDASVTSQGSSRRRTGPGSWHVPAWRIIHDDVARWGEKYPDVGYELVLREGSVSQAQMGRLQPDHLLVVGAGRLAPPPQDAAAHEWGRLPPAACAVEVACAGSR